MTSPFFFRRAASFAAVVVFAFTPRAHAHLGDTFDQMESRYGKPDWGDYQTTGKNAGFGMAEWRCGKGMGNLVVTVHAYFLGGVVGIEDYMIWRNQMPGGVAATFTPDEVTTLLEGNRGDSQWNFSPAASLPAGIAVDMPTVTRKYYVVRADQKALARVMYPRAQPDGPGVAWVSVTTPEYLRHYALEEWKTMTPWESLWCMATGGGPKPSF